VTKKSNSKVSIGKKRDKDGNNIHQKSEFEIPISFFDRNLKQKRRVVRPPQQNLFTGQTWLIDEEYTLTWCMDDQMPITTHPPNREMVASAINCSTCRPPLVSPLVAPQPKRSLPKPLPKLDLSEEAQGHLTTLRKNGIDPNCGLVAPLNIVKRHKTRKPQMSNKH